MQQITSEPSDGCTIVLGGNFQITVGKTHEMDQSLAGSLYWESGQTLEKPQQLEVVKQNPRKRKLCKDRLEPT